jgi:hypothetical protein
MKYKSILYAVMLLVSALFLTQCATQTVKFSIQSGQIPPDYKGYNHTLLVVKQEKAWNKIAEKSLKENYKCKYIFISREDVDKPDYKDIEEFRFVLTKNNYIITGRSQGGMVTGKAATEDLCVFDRKTLKQYCTNTSTSFIGKQLNEYSKALDNARLEK